MNWNNIFEKFKIIIIIITLSYYFKIFYLKNYEMFFLQFV